MSCNRLVWMIVILFSLCFVQASAKSDGRAEKKFWTWVQSHKDLLCKEYAAPSDTWQDLAARITDFDEKLVLIPKRPKDWQHTDVLMFQIALGPRSGRVSAVSLRKLMEACPADPKLMVEGLRPRDAYFMQPFTVQVGYEDDAPSVKVVPEDIYFSAKKVKDQVDIVFYYKNFDKKCSDVYDSQVARMILKRAIGEYLLAVAICDVSNADYATHPNGKEIHPYSELPQYIDNLARDLR